MASTMADTALTLEQEQRLARLVAIYPEADELGARFAAAGHELYLVGGTVRDTLLHGDAKDLDFATSAAPKDSERLLRDWADDVWLTGARFGTVSARKGEREVEITTFRSDRYSPGSRHPDVTFAADIAEDLSRRDFTINAMAVRLPDHRFVDPHGGLDDLRRRRLRTPLDPATSFGDDPLRMVRLARFAATLQVKPEQAALDATTAMADQIEVVSRERIRDEFSRLLLGGDPAQGLDILCDTSLADRFIPEVPALRMEHDPGHHHKDVYAHTLAVVARCPADDLVLRLAALLHDIGKPATREFHPDGKVTFHHHEVVGARMARARLRELRYPNDIVAPATDLVALHLRFHGYSEQGWTDRAVRRYVRDAGSQLDRLNILTRADITTRNKAKSRRLQRAVDELEERIAQLREQEELERIRPPIDGHQIMAHLGIEPGPAVGEAWNMLLEARLDHGPMSEDEANELLDTWARERGLAPGR
jgi:poly(A) polymerase